VVDRVFVGSAGGAGSADNVRLTLDGNIVTSGKEGVGVMAQSIGTSGQGDITITLLRGKQIYAGTQGTGVWLAGGANNTIVNLGTLSVADGNKGWTVRAGDGNDVIDNQGMLAGQLDLGRGVNRLNNSAGQTVQAGEELLLGDARSVFANAGMLSPGGLGLAQKTVLRGSYQQAATGVTLAELDLGSGQLDQLDISGTAELDGHIKVSLLQPQRVRPGHVQTPLFTAALGVVNGGVQLSTAPSAVITYQLLYPNAQTAALDYNIDFSPAGIGRVQQEVGQYFNRIQLAGGSDALADSVVKLLYTPTLAAYRATLSDMTPEFYGHQQAGLLRSSAQFGGTLADDGENRLGDKRQAMWFQYDTERSQHRATDDYRQVSQSTKRYTLGLRKALTEQWSLGGSFATETNRSDGDSGHWTASGNAKHIGAALQYQFGNNQLALIPTYSTSTLSTQRRGETEDFTATASRRLTAYGAAVRYAHLLRVGESLYFRPTLDLGVTRLSAEATAEHGAGPTSLRLDDNAESHKWVRPVAKLGYRELLSNGYELHLHADVGMQRYFGKAMTTVKAGFTGAPAGAEAMRLPVPLDQSVADGVLGVDIIAARRFSLGFRYNTRFSEHRALDRYSMKLEGVF
jgi:hypothetical protein